MRNSREKSVTVIIKHLAHHPHCKHGPTLLFSDENGLQFFACAACRDKKDCNFFLLATDWTETSKNNKGTSTQTNEMKARLQVVNSKSEALSFCNTCQQLVLKAEKPTHHHGHKFQSVTDENIKFPSSFLNALSNDKREAQYFFSLSTLQAFQQIFVKAKINKVICIGAPRLHEFLKNHCRINSILLDIDKRFMWFNDEKTYFHYNMFNHHFFGGEQCRLDFEEFLKEAENENICIFTDPPFACRTEPLFWTLKQITNRFRSINGTNKVLPIMWIFPYFMEMYVIKFMPELQMIDYHIGYENHEVYNNEKVAKGRKQGSPVRLFTNINAKLVVLPESEGYKFCTFCECWVAKTNDHCAICRICPSKNGSKMVHCTKCRICVKPSYVHCNACDRCTQKIGHNCDIYQTNITCWICRQLGHCERNCSFWSKFKINPNARINNKNVDCILCGAKGHNLKVCPDRESVLGEEYFLGEYKNVWF